MKKKEDILIVLLTFVFSMLLAVPVYASDVETTEAGIITETPSQQSEEIRPEWGLEDTSVISIPSIAFRPLNYLTAFGIAGVDGSLTGDGNFAAPLYLPTGAIIRFVDLYYYDDDASENIVYEVGRYYGNTNYALLYQEASTGTPGYGYILSNAINHTVDNSINTYQVTVALPPISSVRLKKVLVYYRLQISPAPSTATFWDVPVGSFWHQYVEALAASGITTGYGDGSFQPDNPVTRGQMAAFLSRALGLHWPN